MEFALLLYIASRGYGFEVVALRCFLSFFFCVRWIDVDLAHIMVWSLVFGFFASIEVLR